MYPDTEAITKQRKRIGNRIAWEREYKLNIIPDEDQIITKSMIHSYETMPSRLRDQYEQHIVGVDLAISKKDWADYTAMVRLLVRGRGKKRRIYVQPKPLNKRLGFTSTIDAMRDISDRFPKTTFYIETTAYQSSAEQVAKEEGFNVIGVKPRDDKRARLNMVANKIERGVVVFPETGAELLIAQLIGFGVEKHDDLMDALTMAVIEILKEDNKTPKVTFGKHNLWNGGTLRSGRKRKYIQDFLDNDPYGW